MDSFDRIKIKKHNAVISLHQIGNFIPCVQFRMIKDCLKSEEWEFFADKIEDLRHIIHTMPKVYEQDGKGEEAVVYLHYFELFRKFDYYITEKDTSPEQEQAFGMYSGRQCPATLGYIDITPKCQAKTSMKTDIMELDIYWTPKTIREIKEKENHG